MLYVAVNKRVQKLSEIGSKFVENQAFNISEECWMDFTNHRTRPLRWKPVRDTSKTFLYTNTYSFYDTIEKK